MGARAVMRLSLIHILLAVTERSYNDCAVHIAELRRFQQRERRDALARSQFKCVGNQRIVFIAANFYLVGIALAVVSELGFHAAFPDKRVKMCIRDRA